MDANRPASDGPVTAHDDSSVAGLCSSCRHVRIARNHRGGDFWRCGLSDADGRFERYPALPVLRCGGYTRLDEGRDSTSE